MSAGGLGAGTVDRPSLNGPGRLAVMFVAALAVAVGLSTTNGAFEAAPYALMGTILAIRRPANSVGWLLLVLAVAFAVSSVNVPATAAQLAAGTASSAVLAIAVVQSSSGGPLIAVLFVITLVFPGGRLPRGAWGQVARLSVAVIVALAVLGVFAPTITVNVVGSSSGVTMPNPLAVFPAWPGWIVLAAGSEITLVLATVGVGSMVIRLRRARGVERAQLRWLVWSMAFIVVGFIIGLVGDTIFDNGLGGAVWLPAIVAFALPPLAIGIAVLRYRLYEIDRLISRTIAYALLTVILASVFVAVILALQALISPLIPANQLAVAASTLLVFLLFQPLRRRVQRARRPALQPRPLRRRADRRRIRFAAGHRGRSRCDRGGSPGHDPRHTGAGQRQPVAVPYDFRGTPVIERSAGSPGGTRAVRLIVMAGWVLAAVTTAAGLATARPGGATDLVTTLLQDTAAMSAVTMGAILVARLTHHPVGWILFVSGLVGVIGFGATNLAEYGLVIAPGHVPGAIWLEWISAWTWAPYLIPMAWLLPLVFPTGRLPSIRWRPVAAIAVACVVLTAAQAALTPFTDAQLPASVQNPLLVTGSGTIVLSVILIVVLACGVVTLPAIAWSVANRYRRGSSLERQQLKWFVAAVALLVPPLLVGLLLSGTYTGVLDVVSTVAWQLVFIGLILLPLAIGIAVLRYRLYEIDRLISRTIAYGLLTLLLGTLFVAVILALQALVAPFTGSNELAVAGSTLLVAALFQPLRRRVQRLVDRRFNRSRYDAERTIAALAVRLRDEVDLDAVRADLLATVDAALEPASASLWLR